MHVWIFFLSYNLTQINLYYVKWIDLNLDQVYIGWIGLNGLTRSHQIGLIRIR